MTTHSELRKQIAAAFQPGTPARKIAGQIAEVLEETEKEPRRTLIRLVAALGEEAAWALLVETEKVEKAGGMMLPDNSRRRTRGGVFFQLARRRMGSSTRKAVFRYYRHPRPAPDGQEPQPPREGGRGRVENPS